MVILFIESWNIHSRSETSELALHWNTTSVSKSFVADKITVQSLDCCPRRAIIVGHFDGGILLMATVAKQARTGRTSEVTESKSRMMITPPTEVAPRLLPSTELPAYTYVPGTDTPHPYRDARGHSYQRKQPAPKMLTAANWAENRHYLLALDYFNHGYYWESHEDWERLLRTTGNDCTVGRFLKGLVKLSAAGVKVRENSIHGVRRHAASAGEVFADVAAEVGTEFYCGLEFTTLQFAADRAAQICYTDKIGSPRQPTRVFPFVLNTEVFQLS